jgi:hypothetical protein
MSSRNFFIKFNLDDMAHDLDTMETDQEMAEWLRGFRRGARGAAPTDQTGARLKGNLFGYTACQEADKYRASRAANRAKGHDKKKSLHTSKEEAESIQHPASSIHETMTYDTTHVPTYVATEPPAVENTGVSTPGPLPKPAHMIRFESQYTKALPFEQTPAGKAAAARAAEIRAKRLAQGTK